jgi:CheY-like chemotaxis protein
MSKSVLIVDDDGDMRDLIRLILENAGYEVALAGSGSEAFEFLSHRLPALIVLDLMMPEMSGLKFAEELERRGLRPGIPVLVLSAASQAGLKAGWVDAEGCLTKPFEIPTLLDEVARLAAA